VSAYSLIDELETTLANDPREPPRNPMKVKIHCARCENCQALLAKLDDDGLTIRRGQMQFTITGESTVAVTCYRDCCHTLNVLASRSP
jgi:hypothetical protein